MTTRSKLKGLIMADCWLWVKLCYYHSDSDISKIIGVNAIGGVSIRLKISKVREASKVFIVLAYWVSHLVRFDKGNPYLVPAP